MRYEEYCNYVCEHMKDYLPEEYASAKFISWDQELLNGEKRRALTIDIETMPDREIKVSPSLHLNDFYMDYQEDLRKSGDPEAVTRSMERIADVFGSAMQKIVESELDVNELFRPEYMERNVMPVLVNYDANRKILQNIPHRQFLNLAVYYRMEAMSGSAIINNILMAKAGLTEEDLYNAALKNMEQKSFQITNMSDMLKRFGEDTEDIDMPMYVITSNGYEYGASAILSTACMDQASKLIGKPFYILPSSVYEVIVIPKEGMDLEEVQRGVSEINRNVLDTREYLSDEVYSFSAQTKEVTQETHAWERQREEAGQKKQLQPRLGF